MILLLILTAVALIAALAWYAGSLLFKLQLQKQKIENVRTQRLTQILESIHVISLAMAQQQCNLSEGCIRLYHLLESLPIKNKPDFSVKYSGIYALYQEVKDLPTHEARKQLSTLERKLQDIQREEKETHFGSQVLADVARLKVLSV
ncbi:DUF2489 domain-containing protein [Paraglaciecola hydrolytica]|uniref:DUF2489 domain-containing protein n=1 Tax=Paraglaciecola hydrolytica TaxID=1799789 RepID=A0A136A4G9_9ALTE|nr:DUF2489 domain-containing protein [Paraglaciecola hydrolytica]KXI30020.1 hypothetical protein AX660_08430 [Paraglaciecola hydrolytica]